MIPLEAEAGSRDGQVIQRSRASGGQTVHLGPGEHRLWTFDVRAVQTQYALSVTYSNGKEGPNEVISLTVDGTPVSSFQNRDSGDSIEGWNLFVTDPAGTSTLLALLLLSSLEEGQTPGWSSGRREGHRPAAALAQSRNQWRTQWARTGFGGTRQG
jgi:hypothetical protein